MPLNFYDLGSISSVANGSSVAIAEAYNGAEGIFRYAPTDDCGLTGKLQGSDNGGTSWTDVITISDPDRPSCHRVTLYRLMRVMASGGSTGAFSGYLEPF